MSGPPLLFDSVGPVPTPPATIQQSLIALVAEYAPGYTAALPASMVEDLSSTDVGAIVTIDQARVDLINSITPYGANAYLLAQQGYLFGLPQGTLTNGRVDVVFSGTPGFAIPAGWMISDGTNQYAVQSPGTVVAANGASAQVTAIATNASVFAIPARHVTQLVTQPPAGITLTVSNPQAGVPAQTFETTQAYRARILTAYQAQIQGVNARVKTLLAAVPGVPSRLVSVRQIGTQWEVICGGGDAYAIGYAIYQGVSSIGLLAGSQLDPTRNVSVSIYDVPDTYNVIFVNPPQQTTKLHVIWNTQLPNFTSGGAVNQYIIAASQAYINSIYVGQPMNLLVLTQAIQSAVSPVIDPINLTTLKFQVTINNVQVGPSAGTSVIASDPESYFYISPSGVTSVQG